MRYELSDYEWTAIMPMLPNEPRGVRRVDHRRVLCARAVFFYRLIPAEIFEHPGELRPLWVGPRASRPTERAKRAISTNNGVWSRRGAAAKGPFAGPQFRNSDPETR
jgi:transposase